MKRVQARLLAPRDRVTIMRLLAELGNLHNEVSGRPAVPAKSMEMGLV